MLYKYKGLTIEGNERDLPEVNLYILKEKVEEYLK